MVAADIVVRSPPDIPAHTVPLDTALVEGMRLVVGMVQGCRTGFEEQVSRSSCYRGDLQGRHRSALAVGSLVVGLRALSIDSVSDLCDVGTGA